MLDEDAYFESEEFLDLLNQYEDSVKSGQPFYMDADDLADIADYYHFEGMDSEAAEAINLALHFNPDAVGPLLYKAREALWLGDFAKAREYAERIRVADGMEYLYMRGEILICEGKTDEADTLFREHFRELPPDEYSDYVYDVARLYAEYQQDDKALEWMSRSKGDDTDEFRELMARTLFNLGKYEDSGRIFNELIDRNPYSARYWNALASSQYMAEDYEASITSSEYAIAIDPQDAEGLLSKANGLYRLENYDDALAYYKRYTDLVDTDDFGYLYQGTCLINLGRYDEAIARLEKAEEVATDDSPYLTEIYQELAFAYNEQKKPESALYYIDKTKDQDCDHADMEVVRGHILLANDRLSEAEEVFRQAIVISGYSPSTMLRIMVSLYENHYVTAAYNLFKKFFDYVEEGWTEGYSYMALCCWSIQHYGEFLKYLQMAVEKNPKEARMVLGHLFPMGMSPSDYVNYITERLKKQ